MDKCFNHLSSRNNFTSCSSFASPLASAVILLAGLCSIGCDAGPEMAPVAGNVLLLGKPLPGGRIIFEPTDKSGDAKSAIGDVAEDGTFELYTMEPGDGVVLGTYYPVVMDPKEDDESATNNKRKKIGIVDLSKTQLEVKSPGPNEFTIEISKEDVKWGVTDD